MLIAEISLDGTLHSSLDWSEQRKAVENAERVLWHLDLGLFSRLPQSLSSLSQYHSLKLSLEHFCNTLWKDFQEKTVGICFYKGSADFSRDFPWDDEQEKNLRVWLERGFGDVGVLFEELGVEVKSFQEMTHHKLLSHPILSLYCRDVAGEYLDLLAGYLPENLEPYICLDTEGIEDPLQIALLTTKERYPHLKMIIDGKEEMEASVGICLPAMDMIRPCVYKDFPEIIKKLNDEGISYRLIPEALLTSEWHGLDILYVSPETISPQGKRKLLGFQATGGTVRSME